MPEGAFPHQNSLERCAVRVTAQQFNDAEKAQARTNIGAVAPGAGAGVSGTFTVSLGGSMNGTLTISNGLITAVQEPQP